jgi:hypothetical protein
MKVKLLFVSWGWVLLLLMAGTFSGALAAPPTQSTPPVGAVTIADYTAFPPFLPRVVSPNILFLLDFSNGMVRPAYGQCNSTLSDCRTDFIYSTNDYVAANTYVGNFENVDYSFGADNYWVKTTNGGWSGNWLNWLTATQFDVIKKVAVGGNINPSPEMANPNNMKLQSVLGSNQAFIKRVELNSCSGLTPDCVNWPTIAYRTDTWAGGTIVIDKNSATALPSGGAGSMVLNKLYKSTSSEPDHDEGIVKLQIPFTVDYFGNNYNTIFVNTNGIMGFDYASLARAIPSYEDFSANDFHNVIAPFFWDLELGDAATAGTIRSATFGTTPDRIYAITYENVKFWQSPTTDTLTFQVLFFEKSGHIAFQYKDLTESGVLYDGSFDGGGFVTAALNNADGTQEKVLSPGYDLVQDRAHFMSNHIAYKIAPNGNSPTNLIAMAPLPSSTKGLQITVNDAAATNGVSCDPGWTLIKTGANLENATCVDHNLKGLVQELRDGELAGLLGFRLGIMNLDNGTNNNGGMVLKHFNAKESGSVWASLMGGPSGLRSAVPTDHAPIAEALFEASGYFQENSAFKFDSGDWSHETNGPAAPCSPTSNSYDPFCFKDASQKPACVKNFVLLVSSGNYSHDRGLNVYDETGTESWWDTASTVKGVWTNNGVRAITGEAVGAEGTAANGGWADNVAYKLHTVDIRPNTDPDTLLQLIPGDQRLGVYVVNTSAEGSSAGTEVLKRIARYGGFVDTGTEGYSNGEDDVKGASNGGPDGLPDTYYSAGGDLRAEIVRAVMDILKNSASGTSVSVLSTSAGGEGALYQAYFYPAKILDQVKERRWPGYLRAFFVDRYQNLHDDNSNGTPDAGLVLNQDRVARMRLNTSDNSVVLDLYNDANSDGVIKNVTGSLTEQTAVSPAAGVPLDNVASLWEGGSKLAFQTKSQRNIYLWLDLNNDGLVEAGSGADFSSDSNETRRLSTSLAGTLTPYLRAKDNIYGAAYDASTDTLAASESTNLIDFLLGNHVETDSAGNHQYYRNRCMYVLDPLSTESNETGCGTTPPTGTKARVWPLGDIVFSTPTLVAGPTEGYDKIYSDATYIAFRNTYKNRRNMVYVGANDGLLHAFNGGVYTQGDRSSTATKQEYGWFIPNPTSGNGWTSPEPELGEELWAFLPYDNLPHILWLACNGTDKDAAGCYNSEYTHVYYADQRPKVTDVRIFTETTTPAFSGIAGQTGVVHPGGWGTIMIMPLRLGGGAMDVSDNFDADPATTETRQFRSAYYAFDITDPEKPPKLLWRFTDSTLGFSTSYPAIAHVEHSGSEKWFMVVGSGPDNNPPTSTPSNRAYGFASSTRDGKIFIVDIANGNKTTLDADSTISSRQVMSDASVIDVDRDFTSDVIYIGSTINPTGIDTSPAYGRIYRISTGGKVASALDPANWTVTKFFDVDPAPSQNAADPDSNQEMGPLVVGPSASKDNLGNLWVYFGTGQLRSPGDLSNSDQQRFYGIKDLCWNNPTSSCVSQSTDPLPHKKLTTAKADLLDTSNIKVYELSSTVTTATQVRIPAADVGTESACGGALERCAYSTFLSRARSKNGWYRTLLNPADPFASERVLSKSSVLGGVVLFTSYQPAGDLCSTFGDSYLYSVYYETGAAYTASVIGSHLEDASQVVQNDAQGKALEGDSFSRNASGQLLDANGAVMLGVEKVFDTRVDLGKGMPTSVGLAVGETTTGFVQKSTGEIKQIRSEPVFKIKSGPTSWREQPTGDGTSGLEMIYRHISK